MRRVLYLCSTLSKSPLLLFSEVQLFATPLTVAHPGSSVHGILQARILVWVAISSSRASSNPGIELESPAFAGSFFITEPPWKPPKDYNPSLKVRKKTNKHKSDTPQLRKIQLIPDRYSLKLSWSQETKKD